MKKFLILLSIALVGCNNYSADEPPVAAGKVFVIMIESDSRIDAGSCTDEILYQRSPTRDFDHRVQVGLSSLVEVLKTWIFAGLRHIQ